MAFVNQDYATSYMRNYWVFFKCHIQKYICKKMCVCKIDKVYEYFVSLLGKYIYKYHSPNYIVFMVLRNNNFVIK